MPADKEITAANARSTRRQTARSISVVIPAHNAAKTIGRTLRSLVPDAELIGEVLVIDDASTDGTADVAAEVGNLYEMPLRIISTRAGSAGGARNAGIGQSTGKFIHLLDADDELAPGGLSLLFNALTGDERAGIAVGANIRRTEGRPDKL